MPPPSSTTIANALCKVKELTAEADVTAGEAARYDTYKLKTILLCIERMCAAVNSIAYQLRPCCTMAVRRLCPGR